MLEDNTNWKCHPSYRFWVWLMMKNENMPCLSLDFLTLFSFCGRRNSELVFQTDKNFDNNQDIFLSPFERNLAIFLMFLKWHLHWKKSDTLRSLSSKSFTLTKMSFKGRREKIMWNVFFHLKYDCPILIIASSYLILRD